MLTYPARVIRVSQVGEGIMELFGLIFAGIGAAAILGALTYVTLLIGGLVNGMVVLYGEKTINELLAKRALKK